MEEAFLASLLAGLATVLGALPLLFFRRIPHLFQDILLGFAAGVMVAASFQLINSGLHVNSSLWQITIGIVLGAGFVAVLSALLPEDLLSKLITEPNDSKKGSLRLAWLTFSAIALHNVPEGLVVGVGFGGGNEHMGTLLALTIGIQNAPEGLVVAAPLREQGVPYGKILALVTLSGLVEPVAAILGFWLVDLVSTIIPFALGVAAGAMLYVTSKELIPESHGHGYEQWATFAFISGVLTMLGLDRLIA